MKTTQLHRIVAVLCGIVLFQIGTAPIYAQFPCTPPVTRTSLVVTETGTGRDTLWFGFDSTATYGLDPHLCEFEIPVLPVLGIFDTRFFNIPGREGWDPPMGLGQGFPRDFRRYVSRTHIDTHKVFFQPNIPPGYPMILRWSIAGLLAICDSARLQDEFGGFFYSIQMHAIDSLRVPASPPIYNLLLIRYGQKLDLMSLHDKSSELSARAMLDQNYPNPFNPVTTIRYQLPTQGHVTLKVYDLLGREVVTLVSGQLRAGEHELAFDGHGLPTAVYYYRLQGKNFVQTKRFILLK